MSAGGDLPDIWIPESRLWLNRAFLGAGPRVRVMSPSVARTPVLLVGGRRAQRFPTWGEAEASGLVTVPDPQVSAVGTLAVVAPQAEARAAGRTAEEAQQMMVPFAQNFGERRARGADEQVWPAMFKPLSPRLVVTTEQELVDTPDGQRLRDLTPEVGAPVLDFPLAVRADAPPGTREVARSLMDHLAGDEGSAALLANGLRPAQAPPAAGARSEVSSYLPTPPAKTVVAAVQSWKVFAVPSAILAVVDASGSMDFDAGSGSRMTLLAEAAGIGLSFLPDHARVGLWVFSIDQGGPGQDWRVLEPIRRLDDLRFGRTQRYALRERAAQLPGMTDGGTGLYDTAIAAYREAVRSYRPNYSNAVVLMTDGQNEDPGSIGLDELLTRLRELRDPERPVRMVGIAISEDADLSRARADGPGDRRGRLPRGAAAGHPRGVRPGGALALSAGRPADQASSSTTCAATQAGLSWPSISTVCSTTSCLPAGRSRTSPKRTCDRSRLSTGTGCGKRTFSSP